MEERWTGVIGWSCDDEPWVGPLPTRPNGFIVAGFCGSGLARTWLAGQACAAMVVGEAPQFYVEAWRPDMGRETTADFAAGHMQKVE